MSEDKLICDADSIAYKAAAANEEKSITTTHIEKGVQEHWTNRTEFRAYIADTNHTEDMYTIQDVQEPRHISYGKTLITNMLDSYKKRTGVNKVEIYIGGTGNFREDIPLPMTYTATVGKWAGKSKIGGRYKENRDDNLRPIQLKELRSYMISELGAIVVNGMEVDDMSSIRAYQGWKEKKGRIIQNTEDKDALQCTGWLMNPQKMLKPILIQGFGELHREGKGFKGTGRMWLYYQALYGDSVDNYHGCDLWKIEQDKQGKSVTFGEAAAFKVLEHCQNDKEALQAVYNQYKAWYPEPVIYTDHTGVIQKKDAMEIMQMYFDCAHMRRWEDDRIIVADMLDKLGVV